MTNRSFSSSQLYALRNEISLRELIEKTMRIPCRVTKGCFRFLCPVCYGFDTAVNPETNLARCFRCKKNFNTIDLVMLVRQAKFVDSVKFLKSIHQKQSVSQNRCEHSAISGSTSANDGRMKRKTPPGKSDSGMGHIGKIVDNVLARKLDDISEKQPAGYKPDNPVAAHQNTDQDRIAKLERQLEYLGCQIQELYRMRNAEPPSK